MVLDIIKEVLLEVNWGGCAMRRWVRDQVVGFSDTYSEMHF